MKPRSYPNGFRSSNSPCTTLEHFIHSSDQSNLRLCKNWQDMYVPTAPDKNPQKGKSRFGGSNLTVALAACSVCTSGQNESRDYNYVAIGLVDSFNQACGEFLPFVSLVLGGSEICQSFVMCHFPPNLIAFALSLESIHNSDINCGLFTYFSGHNRILPQ